MGSQEDSGVEKPEDTKNKDSKSLESRMREVNQWDPEL
jgi:hypothetical protein